jgi:hypothetical protein
MKVLCEFTQEGDLWEAIGVIGPDDILGSVSDMTSGRDIYLFGFRDGQPGLWRAVGGSAEEFGELRKIETYDLELTSPLLQTHEMVIVHPTQGMIRIRFSRVEDDDIRVKMFHGND